MLEFSNFIEVFRDILRTFAGRLRTDRLPAWRSVRNIDGEPIEKMCFFLPQGQKKLSDGLLKSRSSETMYYYV